MTGYMGRAAMKVKEALASGAASARSAVTYRGELKTIGGIAEEVSRTQRAISDAYGNAKKTADGYSGDSGWVRRHEMKNRDQGYGSIADQQRAVSTNLSQQAKEMYRIADALHDAKGDASIVGGLLKTVAELLPRVHDKDSAAFLMSNIQSAREKAAGLVRTPDPAIAGAYGRVHTQLSDAEARLMGKFGKRFGLDQHYISTH